MIALLLCLALAQDAPPPPALARGPVYLLGSERARALLPAEATRDPLVLALAGDPPALEPALAARVRTAGAIELAPADPRDWTEALFPRRKATALMRELWDRLRTGTPCVAAGRAAAFASQATWVAPGERRGELRDPRRIAEPEVVWGLALFAWGMLATEDVAHGDLAPLLAIAQTHERGRDVHLAAYLPPGAGLFADAIARTATARGAGPVLLFDLLGSRRSRDWMQELHLSVLADGDRWRADTREVEFAPGDALAAAGAGPEEERTVERALAVAALGDALAAFDRVPPPRAVVLRGADATVRLALGPSTRGVRRPGGAPSFSRLLVDVVWAPERWR